MAQAEWADWDSGWRGSRAIDWGLIQGFIGTPGHLQAEGGQRVHEDNIAFMAPLRQGNAQSSLAAAMREPAAHCRVCWRGIGGEA